MSFVRTVIASVEIVMVVIWATPIPVALIGPLFAIYFMFLVCITTYVYCLLGISLGCFRLCLISFIVRPCALKLSKVSSNVVERVVYSVDASISIMFGEY